MQTPQKDSSRDPGTEPWNVGPSCATVPPHNNIIQAVITYSSLYII